MKELGKAAGAVIVQLQTMLDQAVSDDVDAHTQLARAEGVLLQIIADHEASAWVKLVFSANCLIIGFCRLTAGGIVIGCDIVEVRRAQTDPAQAAFHRHRREQRVRGQNDLVRFAVRQRDDLPGQGVFAADGFDPMKVCAVKVFQISSPRLPAPSCSCIPISFWLLTRMRCPW